MAGGMTSVYRCSVSDHQLTTTPTTYPRDRCANVEAALVILARGEACVVSSADIPASRARLLAEQVH